MSFIILLPILYFSLYVENGICSYMGTEESLRQNIADLLDGKLTYSGSNLPFDKNQLLDTTPKNQSEYDFIVIGAGSAGATIASRLSEIQNVTVLLIEAGGKEYSIMDIPSMAAALWSNDEIDWNYQTESSYRYCLGMKDRKCNWPRGKVVGGSSVINFMNAMRGNRRDYDGWADDIGDDSWSYRNMLKYFKKLENFDVKGVKFNKEFHNKGGPVHITDIQYRVQLSKSFIEAGKEMGYSVNDHNGAEQIGFAYQQTAIYKGERWSVNRAYLRPAQNRSNLYLTQNSHVHKILLDDVTRNAYGVRYSKNSVIYEVKAKKEIILSAGAVNSPQILMLSGIGPVEHLRKLDINVIKDAAVGENLIDHIAYGRDLRFSVNDSSIPENPDILNLDDPSIRHYLKYRNGTLSYGASLDIIAYLNVNNITDMHSNIEMIMSDGEGMIRSKKPAKKTNATVSTFGILPIILRPRSRGKILLRSNSPYDKPKIYPNYLEDSDDVRVLIKAIRMAIKIGETDALKKHGSEHRHTSSICDSHGVGTDKYWECELRTYTVPFHHPVGTCKMGRKNSSSAVVDPQLKVIGVNGLRVADASIMPNTVCAHLNIPVIAIAEKAADLVKMEYGYQQHYSR